MDVAALFSGGKDSVFAVWLALHQGWNVKFLLTLAPENASSYMFHYPNIRWTKLQAKALGIPQLMRKTKGRKEEELDDLRTLLRPLNVDGIISGAFASEYQRERIDLICEELGLRSFAPLWHKDAETYLSELSQNFEAIITSVSAEGFDAGWLGRRINGKCVADLKRLKQRFGISPCGEGGEYETFVLNAPIFRKRIVVDTASCCFKGMGGTFAITEAHLSA